MTGSEWITTRLVSGHGVASGRSISSPYPAGTIAMQRPFFKGLGLDLDSCWPGTLNLSIAPLEFQLKQPDHCFESVHWTDQHPPETFSFWRIEVMQPSGQSVSAWLYYPHPETKARHWQPATVVEVLAPRLDGLTPGCELAVRDSHNRLRCVDGVRLRARLLEFLKFRSWRPSPFFLSPLLRPKIGPVGWQNTARKPWILMNVRSAWSGTRPEAFIRSYESAFRGLNPNFLIFLDKGGCHGCRRCLSEGSFSA